MGGGGAFSKPIKILQNMGGVKPLPAPTPTPVAPTTSEVSQSAATDMDQGSASRKIKRKGRSATILTSTAGVEGDTTLGKKSLLGA